MDSLFDSIIPLLIILFYLFGNVFRKKGQETDPPPPTEPSYPQPDDEPRSLREEIRRRFEERARQLREETEPEQVEQLPVEPEEPAEPVVQPAVTSGSSVEATLRAQRARLAGVHRKAVEIKGGPASTKMPQERDAQAVYSSIRHRLRSPKAVSEAIVLMEILGTPVGLRKPGEELRPNFES